MLLFLDESYETDGASAFRFAYAGFAIDERKYRGLVAAVYQAKQRFVHQPPAGTSDVDRVALAKRFIVQDSPPERVEIKASKLMSRRQIQRLVGDSFSPGISLASSMLDALQQAGATVFGILSNPVHPADILNPTNHMPLEYQRLFERVEAWMREQHPSEMVSIVPDTLDSYKHNMSACIADFLFRSAKGKGMRHIVVTPFWVDSSVTVGSQLADIIAYILMDSMRPRTTQSALFDLCHKVGALEYRSIDGVMQGIEKV